jgi:hypothetical protein
VLRARARGAEGVSTPIRVTPAHASSWRAADAAHCAADFRSPAPCVLRAASIKDYAYALGMFIITEADAAAIRAVFNQEGELSAANRAAPPVPRGHRQREGACLCPEYRRVDAAASPAAPCNAAASPQGQLARLPSVSDAYAAVPHRPKIARDNPVYREQCGGG